MTVAAAAPVAVTALSILETLACGKHGCDCLRSARQGKGNTHCPAHNDPGPSLTVEDKNGVVLVNCKAECPQDAVITALHGRGLWLERSGPRPVDSEITYDYLDENDELLFQVVRKPVKRFLQRRPDGRGGWLWQLGDVRRVPYRLRQVLDAKPGEVVYIVEGEKDADRLANLGLVATTNAGGAGKWAPDFAGYFAGRQVVVLADNDKPGRDHADAVALSLRDVAKVRVVHLPGLPDKGDSSDWLDSGHTVEALVAVCCPSSPRTQTAVELLERELPERRQVVDGLISEGLVVLAGRPKFGKSWITLQAGLGIGSGGRVLSQIQVERGDVLYLALEDGERRLQDRLRLLLGETPAPARLHLATEWPRLDDGGYEALETWLDGHSDTRAVAIDTWTLIRPRRRRGSDPYEEDYAAVRRLKELADRYHVAIIVVTHTRKPFLGGSMSDFLDEVLGSSGLTGAADTVLVLQRERGKPDAILHVTSRDVKEQERALTWDDQTGWSIGGDADEVRLSRERAAVLAVLREADRSMTPTELAPLLSKQASATKKLLWQMSRDGQLTVEDGRYGAPIPINYGNPGNRGNSGNSGNPGNPTADEGAGQEEDRLPPVTAPGNRVTGFEMPVTTVTRVTTHTAAGSDLPW